MPASTLLRRSTRAAGATGCAGEAADIAEELFQKAHFAAAGGGFVIGETHRGHVFQAIVFNAFHIVLGVEMDGHHAVFFGVRREKGELLRLARHIIINAFIKGAGDGRLAERCFDRLAIVDLGHDVFDQYRVSQITLLVF